MRPEILYPLFTPIIRLKGVGPNLSQLVQRVLGKKDDDTPMLRDLLFHLPIGVLDRRFTSPLREAPEGKVGTFLVRVETHVPPTPGMGRGNKRPYKVICTNETGDITLVFFHASAEWLKRTLPVGERRVISGRIEHFDFRVQMTHPDIIAPPEKLNEVQTVEPVYPLTAGLTNRRLATIIQQGLEKLPALPEWIGEELMAEKSWPAWKDALHALHHPADEADLSPLNPAHTRLAFDELLANQLKLGRLRRKTREKPGIVLNNPGELREKLKALLPFQLTAGQEQVIAEIDADIASGKRMTRLLQGDVGSGKTMVALFSMLRAAESGRQSALMAPTSLIAHQHARGIAKWCEPLGIGVTLLTGGIKGAARTEALQRIAGGEAQIVIGTHALFQDGVEFNNLALVVVDEQHRFGVNQRMALAAKGDAPHLLQMTATPIPRSLTLAWYGDMDCSYLREKPPGRQPIATRLIALSRYEELQDALARAFQRGEKAYWICPMISGSEETDLFTVAGEEGQNDLAAAETRATEFRARFGAENVGLVHGRMKSDARDKVMRAFASGEHRLLVATTVVEVGVDVPDATIMIIEKAERFGLSQLHQLRGRVGRGDKPSSCVLLYSDKAAETARARLSVLRDSEDGFMIAEADLRARGGGDVLGTRQSGLPAFHFVQIGEHDHLLTHAHADVRRILDQDPEMQTERGRALQLLLHIFE